VLHDLRQNAVRFGRSNRRTAHGQTGRNRIHEDLAYIPPTDTYGNCASGYWTSGHGTTMLFIPAGPYLGKPCSITMHWEPAQESLVVCMILIAKYKIVNGPGEIKTAFQEIASYVQRLAM
jgi:hypothetical protein